MSDINEDERKKSSSTVSDVEIINHDEADDNLSDKGTHSRSSSKNPSRRSSTASLNPHFDITKQDEPYQELEEEEPPKPNDPLAVPPISDEEYDAIYNEQTRAKAIVLLIYFSILMVVIPFASMYFCYYHVFNEYDQSTDMLYSGLVAIAEVYILVAIFIFIAYRDEQNIERRLKSKND